MRKTTILSLALITSFLSMTSFAFADFKGDISLSQEKELAVFGIRCLGVPATTKDIKNRSSRGDLEKMIATGINFNGLLCADILEISPLKLKGKYEVECIEYGGGKGKKIYILDALRGKAFEQ